MMDKISTNCDYKEINKSLYGGPNLFFKGKNPYECDTTYCCNTENCPLFNREECLMCRRLKAVSCPYGKVITEKGFGSRSIHYEDLRRKTRTSELYNKMGESECDFSIIGDYVFIRHCCVNLWHNKNTGEYVYMACWSYPYCNDRLTDNPEQKNWTSQKDYSFIPMEKITKKHLKTLLEIKPRTFFDNQEITDYQTKVVPKIKKGILKYFPMWAEELGISKINYVGLQGKLLTLQAPFDFTVKNCLTIFHWDGEFITAIDNAEKMFGLSKIDNNQASIVDLQIKLKPDNLWIEIKDNAWVNENSEIK